MSRRTPTPLIDLRTLYLRVHAADIACLREAAWLLLRNDVGRRERPLDPEGAMQYMATRGLGDLLKRAEKFGAGQSTGGSP